MSETGFVLRWGTGFEGIERRDAVRNKIHAAFELASLGLEYLGVENDTSIRVNIKTPGPDDYHASSVGHRTLNLFFREATLSRGGPTVFYNARGLVHENLHCLRWRTAHPTRLPERAACEGISYAGEYTFAKMLQTEYGAAKPRRSMVESVLKIPKREKENLRKDFLKDVLSYDTRDANSWEWWLAYGYHSLPISKAEVIGIHTVQERIREGHTLSSLLTLSTAEVLGAA